MLFFFLFENSTFFFVRSSFFKEVHFLTLISFSTSAKRHFQPARSEQKETTMASLSEAVFPEAVSASREAVSAPRGAVKAESSVKVDAESDLLSLGFKMVERVLPDDGTSMVLKTVQEISKQLKSQDMRLIEQQIAAEVEGTLADLLEDEAGLEVSNDAYHRLLPEEILHLMTSLLVECRSSATRETKVLAEEEPSPNACELNLSDKSVSFFHSQTPRRGAFSPPPVKPALHSNPLSLTRCSFCPKAGPNDEAVLEKQTLGGKEQTMDDEKRDEAKSGEAKGQELKGQEAKDTFDLQDTREDCGDTKCPLDFLHGRHVILSRKGDYVTESGLSFPKMNSDTHVICFPVVSLSAARAQVAKEVLTVCALHVKLQTVAKTMNCFISSYCASDQLSLALEKLGQLGYPTLNCRVFIESCPAAAVRLISSPSDALCARWLFLCPSFNPVLLTHFIDRNTLLQPST